jgi:replicative DNA helicase
MRVLRDAGTNLSEGANISADPEALIGEIQRSVVVASHADISTDVNLAEETYRVLNQPAPPKPLRLGIPGIDDYLAIYDGNVIVVSADSGVGKTTTVWNGVLNVANKRKVWYVSLEMPASELSMRTACKLARVNLADAFQDRLTDADKERMSFATQDAYAIISQIAIEDSGSMSIEQYAAIAEYKVKNEGVNLIVVDYLQLMTADPKQYRTEYETVTAASKCVRRVARTLNVPTIVVSQLSREGQLRSSNQILQDAHVDLRLSADLQKPGYLQASFKKNRNGPLGTVDVPCELQYGSVGYPTMYPHASAPHPDNRTEPAPF